jgi:hypothetical protein
LQVDGAPHRRENRGVLPEDARRGIAACETPRARMRKALEQLDEEEALTPPDSPDRLRLDAEPRQA